MYLTETLEALKRWANTGPSQQPAHGTARGNVQLEARGGPHSGHNKETDHCITPSMFISICRILGLTVDSNKRG